MKKYCINRFYVDGMEVEDTIYNSQIVNDNEELEKFIKESIVFFNNSCNFEIGDNRLSNAGIDEDKYILSKLSYINLLSSPLCKYETVICNFNDEILYIIEIMRIETLKFVVNFRNPDGTIINNGIVVIVTEEIDTERYNSYNKLSKDELIYRILKLEKDSYNNGIDFIDTIL